MRLFDLEDFFDQYEHRSDLINLASSDAQPWSVAEIEGKGVAIAEHIGPTLAYPDVKTQLHERLRRHCQPGEGLHILPTSGAAEAIALILHEFADATAAAGNRTIGIPAPSFGAFRGLAALLGLPIKFYEYQPSRGWTPDLDQLRELARQCGALVVTNPHNPTGHFIPMGEIEELARAMAAHDGILIVDEVFQVSGESPSAMRLGPPAVIIGSLSKTYGLPGLRLGWIAACEQRLRRLRTLQQYLTLTPSAMTAALGAAILDNAERFSRGKLIRANRRIVMDWVETLADVFSISTPAGGTTVCLTINTALDEDRLFKLFKQKRVLLAPGTRCFGFGDKPWFRLGYATDAGTLRKGLKRIAAALAAPACNDVPTRA